MRSNLLLKQINKNILNFFWGFVNKRILQTFALVRTMFLNHCNHNDENDQCNNYNRCNDANSDYTIKHNHIHLPRETSPKISHSHTHLEAALTSSVTGGRGTPSSTSQWFVGKLYAYYREYGLSSVSLAFGEEQQKDPIFQYSCVF